MKPQKKKKNKLKIHQITNNLFKIIKFQRKVEQFDGDF